jgi:flavin-dependent dehydrogenase
LPSEVLVLGGGAAGCAAARFLTLWGHDVALVTEPLTRGSHLAESVPPSTRKLFDLLGVRTSIDQAGFVKSTGNTVWWEHGDTRIERFANGEGWQLTAALLEAILLRAAIDAGVRVERRRAPIADARSSDAAFILDCTGRAGLMARAYRLRKYEDGQRTVALIARWRPQTQFDIPDQTHTLIESYADGWVWSVPDQFGHRYVATMVDPRTSNLARDSDARSVYEAEIGKTRRFATLLRDAAPVDGPFGWDASMYSASQYVVDRVLLVGDAGSFIDPLSSAGIKKALASGWLAAVAVHTALVRPALRSTALDFFATREAEIYEAFRRLTEHHLAAAASCQDHPFWTDRAGPIDHEDVDDHADVKAAFEQLRAARAIALHRGLDVRIESQPAVSGSEIVLESRIVTPSFRQGVRYVRDVDVVALLELAPGAREVPELFKTYCERSGPVALPDFLVALSTALARRWLVAE